MQYMTRPEIHHADEATYELLHLRMASEGWSRFLTDSMTRGQHHAPTGIYWTETARNESEAMESVKRAVLPVDPNAQIVVAGGPQIVFYNCAPVAASLPIPTRMSNLDILSAFMTEAPRMSPPASGLELLYGTSLTEAPLSGFDAFIELAAKK